jgi:hypothetical protein
VIGWHDVNFVPLSTGNSQASVDEPKTYFVLVVTPSDEAVLASGQLLSSLIQTSIVLASFLTTFTNAPLKLIAVTPLRNPSFAILAVGVIKLSSVPILIPVWAAAFNSFVCW